MYRTMTEIVESVPGLVNYVTNTLDDHDRDMVVCHGMDSGLFSFYGQTDEFYQKHNEEMWFLLEEMAEVDRKSGLDLLQEYADLSHNSIYTQQQFHSFFTWYVVETLINHFWDADAEEELLIGSQEGGN